MKKREYPHLNAIDDKGKLGWYLLGRRDGGAEILQQVIGKSPGDNWCRGQYGGTYGSSQGPFATKAEAEAKLAYEGSPKEPTRCSQCGYLIAFGYCNWEALVKRQACFTCNHWLEFIESRYAKPNVFVIDGYVYSDGGKKSNTESSFLGFGGRRFVILANDGRRIETNNLWGGGEIPQRFRPQLPDTARFESPETKWVEMADGTRCMNVGE